jgi:hypothetical protein
MLNLESNGVIAYMKAHMTKPPCGRKSLAETRRKDSNVSLDPFDKSSTVNFVPKTVHLPTL